jgi:hypothetical protein
MAAQIHAVSTVFNSLRYAADLAVGLDNNRDNVCVPQEFECSCQASGARASDYRGSDHFIRAATVRV